jgi:hypothetical protein
VTSATELAAACDGLVADLTALVARTTALWSTAKANSMTEIEAAAVCVECFMFSFYGVQHTILALYPKRDPLKKESKPVRQQREALLAVLKPTVAKVTAVRVELIQLLEQGERDKVGDDDAATTAIPLTAPDAEVVEMVSKKITKAHSAAVAEFVRQLKQMDITFTAA